MTTTSSGAWYCTRCEARNECAIEVADGRIVHPRTVEVCTACGRASHVRRVGVGRTVILSASAVIDDAQEADHD